MDRIALALFVAALIAGLSPAWRATARPEALFSAVLFGSVWLAFVYHTRTASISVFGAFTLLALCVFSLHPKGLFFLPLMIFAVSIMRVEGRAVLVKGVSSLVMLIGAAQSVSSYGRLYDCPNAPYVASELGRHMINPSSALQAPSEYLTSVIANLFHIHRYADAIVAPKTDVYWGWLPAHDLGLYDAVWSEAVFAVFATAVAVIFLGVFRCICDVARTRVLTVQSCFPLILLACLIGLIAHQSNPNLYDGVFIIGLLGFTAAVCLHVFASPPTVVYAVILSLLMACMVINVVGFVAAYGSLISRVYTFGIEGKFPSAFHGGIELYNYSAVRTKLWELSKQCNLDLAKVDGIVVDDSSYPYAQRSLRPIHTMGTNWFSEPGSDQYKVFQTAGIEAVLARCDRLKPAVVSRSRQLDGFCCAMIKSE
jgi:hypothetical protein